jgi:hypothetical protein
LVLEGLGDPQQGLADGEILGEEILGEEILGEEILGSSS